MSTFIPPSSMHMQRLEVQRVQFVALVEFRDREDVVLVDRREDEGHVDADRIGDDTRMGAEHPEIPYRFGERTLSPHPVVGHCG